MTTVNTADLYSVMRPVIVRAIKNCVYVPENYDPTAPVVDPLAGVPKTYFTNPRQFAKMFDSITYGLRRQFLLSSAILHVANNMGDWGEVNVEYDVDNMLIAPDSERMKPFIEQATTMLTDALALGESGVPTMTITAMRRIYDIPCQIGALFGLLTAPTDAYDPDVNPEQYIADIFIASEKSFGRMDESDFGGAHIVLFRPEGHTGEWTVGEAVVSGYQDLLHYTPHSLYVPTVIRLFIGLLPSFGFDEGYADLSRFGKTSHIMYPECIDDLVHSDMVDVVCDTFDLLCEPDSIMYQDRGQHIIRLLASLLYDVHGKPDGNAGLSYVRDFIDDANVGFPEGYRLFSIHFNEVGVNYAYMPILPGFEVDSPITITAGTYQYHISVLEAFCAETDTGTYDLRDPEVRPDNSILQVTIPYEEFVIRKFAATITEPETEPEEATADA